MNLINDIAALLYGDWQGQRLLRMDFPREDGPDVRMLVNSIDADEGLSRDFTFHVEVLSDDASIPINKVMGRMVTVSLVRNDGTLRYFNGYVTQFGFTKTDGGFAHYRMVLSPWLAFLRLRQECRLFQNMTLVELCDKTFEHYLQRDFQCRLIAPLPDITLAVQYNETDHNHIHRRLEDAGLFYWYEHRYDGHTLWVSDDSTYANPLDGDAATIEYRAESGSIEDDGISHWMPEQVAVPTQSAVGSYDFKHASAANAEGGAVVDQGLVPAQEVFESTGAYGFRDAGAGEALAERRMDQLAVDGITVTARGNHRALQPGRSFTLAGHFFSEGDGGEHMVVSVRHIASNNYQNNETSRSEYTNEMRCVRKNVRWRPPRGYNSTDTRIYGVQTATVVGPPGEEIYTDEYGRVRVQFHWHRDGKSDPTSSPWVRVMTAWAGSQFGQIALPRVGDEVVVQYLEGNCDRPLIVGALANTKRMPNWQLPSQRALCGLRSNELKAAKRGNHLLLDDTPGQIQAQLKSDHQHSQLSLGHINRVEDNLGRKDGRGEGWELRTDGHGVARAAKGLLITTEARQSANGAIKDMRETLQRLDIAQQCHESLTDLAQQNGAQDCQPDAVLAIKRQTDEIAGGKESPGAELSAPHLVLASPAGIHSNTAGSTHLASLQHTALTSGQSLSIATGGGFFASVKDAFRLFVRKTGMKLIAAEANIDLQALSDSINLLAKLNITQTANRITITAKEEIVINGGGSYAKYNAGGIEHGTTGKHIYHGASHDFLGPKSVEMAINMPSLVDTAMKGMGAFHLGSHAGAMGKSGAGLPFKLCRDGAVVEEGQIDERGNISFEHDLDSEVEYQLELPNGQVFVINSGDLTERHEASAGLGHHGYCNQGGCLTDDHDTLENDRLLSDLSVDIQAGQNAPTS